MAAISSVKPLIRPTRIYKGFLPLRESAFGIGCKLGISEGG